MTPPTTHGEPTMKICPICSVYILWPDGPRYVSAERVIGWAVDSWSDHQDGDKPETIEQAMALLSDRGEVTFSATQPVLEDHT